MNTRSPGAPPESADYRTSALGVRVLQVDANHARGSLTIGTLAAIIIALTFAWYPTIDRLRFELECQRAAGADAMECILTRQVLLFHTTQKLHFDGAIAYVDSAEAVAEECPSCSRVLVRTRESTRAIGLYPATLADARAAADDLNDFFTTPSQTHVHVAYGPGFDLAPVLVWAGVALLLAASLVVRRFHKVILKWDPVERYLTVERRQWPFPRKVDHIPNDLLVGVGTTGTDLLETELRFASGRKVSLFGRTAGNWQVHARAVMQIERLLVEAAE